MGSLLSSKNTHLGDAKVKRTILLVSTICSLAVILVSSNVLYATATLASNENLTTSTMSENQPNVATQETTQLPTQQGQDQQQQQQQQQPPISTQSNDGLKFKQPGLLKPDSGAIYEPIDPIIDPDTSTNFECDTSGSNQQCYCRGNADCYDMGRAGVCSGSLSPHPGGGSGTYKCEKKVN